VNILTKKIFIKVDEDVYNEWNILKASVGKTWKEMLGFSFELLGTYYDKGMDAMIQRFKRMRARERLEEIERTKKKQTAQTEATHLPIKKTLG
jgi:hypothetical protein